MPNQPPENQAGKAGFSYRAAGVAVFLTLFLAASSSYIALKLGALPWPIIFSVIVSGGLIKILSGRKPVDIHEINVAQAGASIGGLVAAGIVFTIPGIIFLNEKHHLQIDWPDPFMLALVTVCAGLLGVLLSVPLKQTFVDREKLPYPSGTAGAELLKLGKTGGRLLLKITLIGALAAVFALLRDLTFPAGFALTALAGYGIFVTLYPMPLALGSGYILGLPASFSWFAGAVAGWFLLIPLLIASGTPADAAQTLARNLGMGLVLGSGIGFFVSYVAPRLKSIFQPFFEANGKMALLFPLYSLLGFAALAVMGVPLLAALLAVVLVWVMVGVAARMTGETNINPLEQFGIFAGLVIALIYTVFSLQLSLYASFMIVTFVSVACAVAGDAGHDYKSAAIIGTKFRDIVKVDLITVVFAGLAVPFILELIRRGFADVLFTPLMPAPQAELVAGSIFGFAYPSVFLTGFGVAFVFELASAFLPETARNKVMIMPFGIGLFLGMGLAIPLVLGAVIRLLLDRKRADFYSTGVLIAAGIMGGEGIAGFTSGALTTTGMSFETGAWGVLVFFALLALAAAFGLRKKQPANA